MRPKVYFSEIKGKSYKEVWDLQTTIHNALITKKLEKKNLPQSEQTKDQNHQLIFCEHSPVYTLGKSGSPEHLLLSVEEIKNQSIEFFRINRGGDITYHGPGQITGYPIFDLDEFFTDVHLYVRKLEEVIILYLQTYGIKGIRIPEYTGVWIAPDHTSPKYRKICAIGVHLSRWVSMHGFALNVNTDLTYFDKIIPCGIVDHDKGVTSLQNEIGYEISLKDAGRELSKIFSEVFDFELITKQMH
jgi:lipoyl(octanoyl) transferase